MKTNEIVWVTSDTDWEALYANGKRETHGHRIRVDDALSIAAGFNAPFKFRRFAASTEQVDDLGEYPENLEDVRPGP